MELLKETAQAKVNLTLRVHGRRADGFHEIESLVVFAGVGDQLELSPGGDLALSTEGHFAEKLTDNNLVLEAARMLCMHCPGIRSGQFRLEKRLPVAAGLGGGSADAAAALRLLQRINAGKISTDEMFAVARELGSDVPACFASRSSMMRGRGEQLSPLSRSPELPAVLVNPRIELGAGEVYTAIDADPVSETFKPSTSVSAQFATIDDFVRFVRSTGNDLQPAAIKLAPAIDEVRSSITETEGCLAAQMSGSGPTCFGLYRTHDEARAAAQSLVRRHPDWWVVATQLG